MGALVRHRLRGSAEFADLFRRGKRFEGPTLQLLARRATGSTGRLGFVTGKKLIARAVDRNRVRRLIREAVRLRRPAIDAYDLVVRVRSGISAADLSLEIAGLLDRLTLARLP